MAYQNKDFLHAVQPVFAASSPIAPMFMPTDGVITETRLSFLFNMTIPTSGTGTSTALGLFLGMFTNLSISAAGKQYLQVNDPLLALAHQRMRGIPVVNDTYVSTTTGNAVTFKAELVFHWGSNPAAGRYDLTGGILAPEYSQGGLVLNLTWPANTIAGGGGQIINTTTAFRVINSVVVMSDGDYRALKASGHFAEPSFTEFDHALSGDTTASSGYITPQNIPVGQYLRGLTILQESSATAATDANINQMGLFSGGGSNNQVITGNWIDLAQMSHREALLELVIANTNTVNGTNPGFAYLDFQKIIDPRSPGLHGGIFGANLTKIPLGQYFIGYSVQTASGNLKYLAEQVTPTAA